MVEYKIGEIVDFDIYGDGRSWRKGVIVGITHEDNQPIYSVNIYMKEGKPHKDFTYNTLKTCVRKFET